MKNKKVIEIKSLSEYIKYITDNNLKNFISRGENRKFENIVASAFRYSKTLNFYESIDNFYNIIGNDITNMQKNNFVAFSQHHGIPTNLVDFSTSPLVSLFFSCYGNKHDNKEGYVYFIDKMKLININEDLIKYNILQMLLDQDPKITSIIIQLYKYVDTHQYEILQLLTSFINKLKYNEDTRKKYNDVFKISDGLKDDVYFYDNCNRILREIIEVNSDERNVTDFILQDDIIVNYKRITQPLYDLTQYVYFDIVLLIIVVIKVVLSEFCDFSVMEEGIKEIELPFYFSYYPPNILSRVSNQSSLFIYQMYYDDNLPDFYIDTNKNRVIQTIVPDYVVKIENQNEILKDLDTLGINLKFIYNDYDNIAKYITNKHVQ